MNHSKQKAKQKDQGLPVCTCCGKAIYGFPALTYLAPAFWEESYADEPDCELNSDFCIIKGQHCFIRVVLRVPIQNTDQFLEWGVWVSLSQENARRYAKVYGTKKELEEEPYFGWLASQIPAYPGCLRIKVNVQLQGGGLRPLIELDPDDPHPLCQEQHTGITLERAHALVKELLPGWPEYANP